jgi:hypothetical protein
MLACRGIRVCLQCHVKLLSICRIREPLTGLTWDWRLSDMASRFSGSEKAIPLVVMRVGVRVGPSSPDLSTSTAIGPRDQGSPACRPTKSQVRDIDSVLIEEMFQLQLLVSKIIKYPAGQPQNIPHLDTSRPWYHTRLPRELRFSWRPASDPPQIGGWEQLWGADTSAPLNLPYEGYRVNRRVSLWATGYFEVRA